MKIDRPLMNPLPKEVVDEGINQTNQVVPSSRPKDQMGLNIDNRETKLRQIFGTLKSKLKKRADYIEVSPFWKNPAYSFMIISSLSNILILLIGGILKYNDLPQEMQLFYNSVDGAWISEKTSVHVIVIPVLLICLLLIQFRFVKAIFKSDRKLSSAIAWIMTILNIFLMIAVSEIYQLNPT